MIAWRVLLAKDDPLTAQATMDILAELPVEVSVAGSGREALERTQAAHPDLLLLNTTLPELDGFEVATALKASPATRDIPIILMTARSRVEDKVRGLELGAEDCLVKPVRWAELLARVKSVFRRAEA
jgi:DNA-binding response OmpR family regulator